jgi:quinol monooxygenase YgiN
MQMTDEKHHASEMGRRAMLQTAGAAVITGLAVGGTATAAAAAVNLVYFLQEDRAKPGHFVFYEVFASQADFHAHNAMPYVQEWFAKLPELADGGVEVMRMAILDVPKN